MNDNDSDFNTRSHHLNDYSMSIIFYLLIFGAVEIQGYKILAVTPMPVKSHHNLLERIVLELTKKGHEVTFLTIFKQPKPVPNLKEVIIPDYYKELSSMLKTGKNGAEGMFEMRHKSKYHMTVFYPKMGPIFMDKVLSMKQVQDLLKSDEKFDLVLGNVFLDESLLAGLSYKYKASLIGVAIFMPNLWSYNMVGNPAPVSYVSNSFLGFSNKMTFWERLENTIYSILEDLNYRLFALKGHDKIMRKYFGDDLPPIEDIIKNTSLVFVNHHFSLAYPRPYLPNMVEIGGYHVPPAKPLPPGLEKYFGESENGVILFSMGSHLKSSQIPKEKKDDIIKAFSRLKEDVLWKFEDDTLTDLPKNVRVEKWLPQSDILAHPNLKLFITHGGLLSTTEAVTRGVPLIGIPIMADQPLNMKYTTAAGFGITLNFDDLNEETMYTAIQEVLNNSKYRQNVKRGSVLIQDTPLPSLDTAIFWIEYVLRHDGAPHLRSAAQDLVWYQLNLLDVLGAILITLSIFIYVIFLFLKLITKKLYRKKIAESFKKKN